MKIYGSLHEDVWSEAGLFGTPNPIVSVVGAGGKSSLIRHFSEILNKHKMRHFIVTTTHMWPVDAGNYGVILGLLNDEGKVLPPTKEEWEYVLKSQCPVLVESDGSKGLPCKAPESWEPVLIPETTHVFAVLGAECLGKQVKDSCHRPYCVANVLGCSVEHSLDIVDLKTLFMSESGLYKDVSKNCKYYCVINQVDNEETYERVRWIKDIMREERIRDVFFTQLNN